MFPQLENLADTHLSVGFPNSSNTDVNTKLGRNRIGSGIPILDAEEIVVRMILE